MNQPERQPDLKECPKCFEWKRIDTEFGYRLMAGHSRPQSYCRKCRGAEKKRKSLEQINSVMILPAPAVEPPVTVTFDPALKLEPAVSVPNPVAEVELQNVKNCTMCKQLLPLDRFRVRTLNRKDRKTGGPKVQIYPSCKECTRKYNNRWSKNRRNAKK
jgi:hypothetical protein